MAQYLKVKVSVVTLKFDRYLSPAGVSLPNDLLKSPHQVLLKDRQIYMHKSVGELARALLSFKRPTRRRRTETVPHGSKFPGPTRVLFPNATTLKIVTSRV